MAHTVYCVKLDKEAEGLDRPPFPNELGQRIYHHISKEAWRMWLNHQTLLVNEMRLNLMDPEAQQFLMQQMEAFFFGEGADTPEGYVPPAEGH